ncbi:MAG TPA: hypothetical protein VJU59_17880, partial [Paraburkholderia sp.]|nr:hypothetical protein [Paraburkholderia sp.]
MENIRTGYLYQVPKERDLDTKGSEDLKFAEKRTVGRIENSTCSSRYGPEPFFAKGQRARIQGEEANRSAGV